MKCNRFLPGDIVTPIDGSSMSVCLHKELAIWSKSMNRVVGFKPVKVVAVEGNLLGVSLLDNNGFLDFESYLYTGEGDKYDGIGSWVHRNHFTKIEVSDDRCNNCKDKFKCWSGMA